MDSGTYMHAYLYNYNCNLQIYSNNAVITDVAILKLHVVQVNCMSQYEAKLTSLKRGNMQRNVYCAAAYRVSRTLVTTDWGMCVQLCVHGCV